MPRRVRAILSAALVTAGLVVLIDAGVTLAWREPLSTIYGSIKQGEAENSLEDLGAQFRASSGFEQITDQGWRRRHSRRFASLFERQMEVGGGIGRMTIPAIGLETVFVHGTDTSSLRKGPGHYPETALPGAGRTVAIAGHRTTYLAPFRDIDEIEPGGQIVLEMPYGTFTYRVEDHTIVDPSEVGVVRDVGRERLVLTACHPLYSAAQRWVVFARLVGAEPGASRP